MTHDEEIRFTEDEARKLMGWAFSELPRPQRPAPRPAVDTLGTALDNERKARGWGHRQTAMALGVDPVTYQRWRTDEDLPPADKVEPLCHLLRKSPVYVLPMIAESCRHILQRALDELADATPLLRAARQRGPDLGDADQAFVLNLPVALRNDLAARAATTPDDVAGVVALMREAARRDPDRQRIFIDGVAAALRLEGEENWE